MSATRIPSVGLFRTPSHRYHWNGGPAMPGVTSVIANIDKSGPLIGWAKGVTADVALANVDRLAEMVKSDGVAPTKAWLTAHATAEKDRAGELGTRLHIAAERIARGQPHGLEDEFLPWLQGYQRFLSEWQPNFRSLERYCANLKVGYGGTFDFIAMIGGKWTLGDLKTGRNIYTEGRVQLTALGHAEFIGLPGDPKKYPMPKIAQYVVLHVRPESYAKGYQLYRINVDDADWQTFLGALQVHRWKEAQPSKGEPMQPIPIPVSEVAA